MRFGLLSSLTIFTLLANAVLVMSSGPIRVERAQGFVGGVYVMSNDFEENSIIAYGRRSNGTLENIGSFRTGGKGAAIDDMDGIDPLFSAFSVILTPDKRFVIAVNPGSSSVSVFKVLRNFQLRLQSVRPVAGFGPVSVAFSRGLLYVSSVSRSPIGEDFTLFGFKGALTGFRLTKSGKLRLIKKSVRRLSNRPAAIQFSPDGRSLVVSSAAAGSVDLDTTKVDEISVFRVVSGGLLSKKPVDTATSTLPNNPEGRSLPGAIGFEIVRIHGVQYVVVSEPRFQAADGTLVTPSGLQASSISTWRLTADQKLIPVQLDVPVGTSVDMGQAATCWIEFSKTLEYFWVANTASASISAFSFKNGQSTLVEEIAGNVSIPIDLWRSADGRFLYQLNPGVVDVFEIENGGRGPGLTKIQSVEEDIPDLNVQGIVAI